MFNNCAFVTLTYDRNASKGSCWKTINNDFNRYVQRLSRGQRRGAVRPLGKLEYLRAYESHEDGYPHVHALFILDRDFDIRDRDKFLREEFRKSFRSAWPRGHVDAQSPKRKSYGAIAYILKYLSKSTSSNTLWSRLLSQHKARVPKVNDLGYPIVVLPGVNVWKYVLDRDESFLLYSTLKYRRVKLLMWSRGFVNAYKQCLITK